MKKLRLVKQRNSSDCAIACLAMATGKAYKDVDADFEGDVESNGVTLENTMKYLGNEGYDIIYKTIPTYLHKNFGREEMLKPFAPRHIVRIQWKFDDEFAHLVVMDENGILYCPSSTPDEKIRTAYMITDVVGIFPPKLLTKTPK